VNDADVEQVFDAMLPSIGSGTIVAVQSTVHPDTCRRLAERAAPRGAIVIDAPVSGGAPAADAGTLLVMVGGDADAVERARPVFETYGNPVVHIGPLGTGQLAKLVNNVIFTAHLTVADDALALGEAWGLDRAALARVLTSGSGNSFAIPIVAGMGFDLLRAQAAPLLRKDVDIVTALASSAGAPTGVLVEVADVGLTRMQQPPASA
jgi:3-hydroxyisobutyrate dehydrogenase-like beta-hydroxyacid dehydrogenase